MTKNKYKVNEESLLIIIIFLSIILLSLLMVKASRNNKIEGEITTTTHESETTKLFIDHNVVIPPANVLPEEKKEVEVIKEFQCETLDFEEDEFDIVPSIWDDVNFYLLAKIAMAEAEGESFETKMLVILTVLNRVESNAFPNTVYDVIFQNYNGVYQFSPVMPGGRWWTTEPNEECWKAAIAVCNLEYDISEGALYFEACKNENNWHSRNLTFICQSSNTRFYK